jgi:hypothetical protein
MGINLSFVLFGTTEKVTTIDFRWAADVLIWLVLKAWALFCWVPKWVSIGQLAIVILVKICANFGCRFADEP